MAGETRRAGGDAEGGQEGAPPPDGASLMAYLRGLTRTRYFSAVLLAAIIGLALYLRLWGNNWDAGQHIHPDERFLTLVEGSIEVPSSLGEYFNSEESPFN